MKRFIKWSAGILAAIIIIAAAAVYIFLSLYDFNDFKPVFTKMVYENTGRELTIDGDVDIKIGISPSLVLPGVKFQNASWGSRPEMAKLDSLEVQIALLPLLSRDIVIKRFILINPDILVESGKSGKLNTEFSKTEKIVQKAEETPEAASLNLPSLTFNKLEIVNATLVYRDGKTGKSEQVIIKHMLASSEDANSPVNLDISGTYNDASFDLRGETGPLSGLTDPAETFPLDIKIEAFGALINLKGTIKDAMTAHGIDLGFTVDIDEWEKLSDLAGQPIPVKDSLNISGQVNDSGPKAYSIRDFKIILGKSVIEGKIGVNLAEKTPYVDVGLSSKNLDLRPVMGSSDKKDEPVTSSDTSGKEGGKLFSSEPLPVDALKQVDGKFQFRFAKIILPQLAIDNLEMDVTMKAGSIDVKPLKANAGGGSVNGAIAIRPSGNALEMVTRLTCAKVNLGDTLKQAGITNMLEGIIDVEVDLGGKGSSMAALMADLNGYTSIIMGQGRISNKYLDKIGGGISDSLFRLLNPAREKKDYTAIKCAVGRFDAVKGVADVTVLAIDTEIMRVAGAGEINLKTEQLNLSLKPEPKKGIGGLTLNLGELAQPFRLAGTLASPSLSLDKAQTAAAIGNLISGGLGSLLRKTETEEADLCAAAVEIAKTGVKPAVTKDAAPAQPASESTIEDVLKDPEKALKNLFGR